MRAVVIVLAVLAGVVPAPVHADELTENFVRACMAKGGTERACTCAHDRLRKRYGGAEYGAFEQRVERGDEAATREMTAAAAACRQR